MNQEIKAKADFLFEVSWEVCNKYGGIFTVVKSKAAQMVKYYDQNYYLIGPYVADKAKGQFEEAAPPDNFKGIFANLSKEGIKCHYGRWLIEGEPRTILVDFEDFRSQKNNIKKHLWELYKIDSLDSGDPKNSDFEFFDEPVIWSSAVGKLLEQFILSNKDKKVVCQFHEWLCGAALLYLKEKKLKTGLVFTTHATWLGRTIAGLNLPLYDMLKKIDADKEAYNYHVYSKHQIEKTSAHKSDVFTTVSEITAIEAEAILGRKPEVLLFNGLDLSKFPSFEEIAIKHRIQRDRIREFMLYYFAPYYDIDVKNTLFYSLFGRYEYRNKGIDLFIKALAELNLRLKKDNSAKTIVGLIFVPTEVRNIKQEVLESREVYRDIKDYYDEIADEVKDNVLSSLVTDRKINREELFSNNFLREMKRKTLKLRRKGLPPTSTHDLSNKKDITLAALKEIGIENKAEDKVKVIFFPVYLTGSDGLINTNYLETIQGSHLGVFPSFYEPWGYTPLETAAMGVSSLTTDLAGFGRFLKKGTKDRANQGVFVLDRLGKPDKEIIKNLTEFFYDFSKFTHQERVKNKLKAREMAAKADWAILVKNYIRAHNQALEKSGL